MAQYDYRNAQLGQARTAEAVDAGLRAYMLAVYNYMTVALAVTGLVAYILFTQAVTVDQASAFRDAAGQVFGIKRGLYFTPLGYAIFATPVKWAVMLAPLAFVFFLSFRVHAMSVAAAQTTFWLFAAVMGVSLSSIFLVFTGESIVRVFFITAAAFAGLSLFGYTTKKDLSGWGSFLIMGVIGIVIAALVNIFLQSSALQFAISVLGVLIFAGLTAYDTQRIKDEYYQFMGDATMAAKGAIMGALSLYLNFINMFTSLLQLFGNRE